MPETLFEIEPGIFSLSEQDPEHVDELVLAVQPFVGMPLDEEGMQSYVASLYKDKDHSKFRDACLYEIGIKAVIGLRNASLVTLEERSRVEDLAGLQRRYHRADYRRYGLADSYIVAVEAADLCPDSGFPQKLSRFLSKFQIPNIEVIGNCEDEVLQYLSGLPAVQINGSEQKLGFVPNMHLVMTPARNPLGYARRSFLLPPIPNVPTLPSD